MGWAHSDNSITTRMARRLIASMKRLAIPVMPTTRRHNIPMHKPGFMTRRWGGFFLQTPDILQTIVHLPLIVTHMQITIIINC